MAVDALRGALLWCGIINVATLVLWAASKRSHRYRISRGMAIIAGFFIVSVVHPFNFLVLPWLLSLLTPHLGWSEHGPAAWNMLGLFPVVAGRSWPGLGIQRDVRSDSQAAPGAGARRGGGTVHGHVKSADYARSFRLLA